MVNIIWADFDSCSKKKGFVRLFVIDYRIERERDDKQGA